MNPLTSAILISFRRNAAYGVRLIDDVAPTNMIAQPPLQPVTEPGGSSRTITLNHPAWIFAHLNIYSEIAAKMMRGETFPDPADHPYGSKSEPINRLDAYPPKAELLAAWRRLHEDGEAALQQASVERTSSPTPLERWRTMHPTIGDMLVMLLVKHESAHLGQLSAWRRACGYGRVAM